MGKGEKARQGKQALYRQYRSTSFDEVVGQEHVTELLKTAVKNGGISHAYLFTGPRGTGKTSVARILAFAANDIPYSHNAQHLDIIEIDAASNRRIDDIRDLREKVHIAPTSAPYKVYIIDEVHMLTGESFNALLKTLEEPPAHAIFILATTELNKVPATIISRTQRFNFRPVTQNKVIDHLSSIAKKENIVIDEASLELIAEHGGGSVRDSISLLDQMGSLGVPITIELVESVLGKASSQNIEDLVGAVLSYNNELTRNLLQNFINNGLSPITISEQLVRRLLKDTSSTAYKIAEDLMSVPRAQFPQLLLLSTLLRHSTRETATENILYKPTPVNISTEKSEPVKSAKETESDVVNELASTTYTKQNNDDKSNNHTPVEETTTAVQPKSDFDWTDLLTAIKTDNAPLHSVLARAESDFSNNRLTLSFKYALHRKKMQQPQYKAQLASLISDTFGISPEIVIAEDSPQLAADPTAREVASIMGGGEVVEVENA